MNCFKKLLGSALFILTGFTSLAQPATEPPDLNKDKPKHYEERTLKSEKTGEKKFTIPRRVFQNTVTHYNYYFNAKNKLNQVISNAKQSFKDDYTKLLSFYPYTLDATAQQKTEIDSVIYKCTAGILLHDLRNDWIDNLYLLLGKAYMYRKDFDSATQTFQYINYAYAPKDDGYDVAIGSNSSNTNGVFTIATKETKNVLKKIFTHPQSRNEAFLWQARNFIEQNETSDAAGLIEILKNDPNFPKRLNTELNEVIAYWFYKQQMYDSSAHYLSRSLSEADGKQDRSRWEYLIAQMYSLSGKNDLAIKYFNRAIDHTFDPVMEVYARLYSIQINNSGKKESYLQSNLNDLLKMAKKDKYQNYQDIIYYAAAQVELERKNYTAAQELLLKSVKASVNNPKQKSEAFLLLADLNYDTKSYIPSANYYDSTNAGVLTSEKDKQRVNERKPALKEISRNARSINTQDSLQRIARMSPDERETHVRKVVKQLRKEKGLKDDGSSGSGSVGAPGKGLFDDGKGDWYFTNPSLKAKGYSEFKARWGNRPNVDNWRRQQAVSRGGVNNNNKGTSTSTDDKNASDTGAITYEALLAKIPLTPEQLQASNLIIEKALAANGGVFNEQLQDHLSAIETFEELLRRFPNTSLKEDILFNLIYLYGKANDLSKQDAVKQQLLREFPNGKHASVVKDPASASKAENAATKKYEQIYNLFIEGKFEQAINEKRAADQQYGNNFWTPQLLFIESIYYIRQKDDNTAIAKLTELKNKFASSPLAEKAATMIDVLRRRTEIEQYLTNLDVERKSDAPEKRVEMNDQQIVNRQPVPKQDVTNKAVDVKPVTAKVDSVAVKPITSTASVFRFVPEEQQYVLLVLNKVDPVYVNEARNALSRHNREKFFNQKIDFTTLRLDTENEFLLMGPFINAAAAVDYVDKTKPVAQGRIFPWLPADKYSFLIISNTNLDLLKTNKDLPAYKKMLTETLPGKF